MYEPEVRYPIPSAAAFETRDLGDAVVLLDQGKRRIFRFDGDDFATRHYLAAREWARKHYQGAVFFGGYLCGDFNKVRTAWVIAWWTEEFREALMSRTTINQRKEPKNDRPFPAILEGRADLPAAFHHDLLEPQGEKI